MTYNLEYKPPGEVKNTGGHITIEAAEATNNFLGTYLGSDQSELGYPALAMKGPIRSEPPFLAVSDEYTEFVRSGNIKIIQGHAKDFKALGERTITVDNDTSKESLQITNIAAVILATGFDAAPSLNFLPPELLETLQFDPSCDEFPLALNVNTVVNRSLPALGFVGFYRSPYWGVMEMQARYLAKLWSGDTQAAEALNEGNTMDTMLKLRRDPRRGQFPMGDYAYLMESFSKVLDIKRQEPVPAKNTRTGLVFPPRYTYADSTETEKAETVRALMAFNDTFVDSEKKGKFLARAVFRAMQGDWKLERQIESFISTYPSGTFSATAKFLPRCPTEEGYDGEYLYVESGEFSTTTGMKFTAKRRYDPLEFSISDPFLDTHPRATVRSFSEGDRKLTLHPVTHIATPHQPTSSQHGSSNPTTRPSTTSSTNSNSSSLLPHLEIPKQDGKPSHRIFAPRILMMCNTSSNFRAFS